LFPLAFFVPFFCLSTHSCLVRCVSFTAFCSLCLFLSSLFLSLSLSLSPSPVVQ
jgi:hypothetical protein